MATAVLRSHDALSNRMHLDAFTPSPTKPPRRRRSPKPAASSSPPPKGSPVGSPPLKAAAASTPAPRGSTVGSPVPKPAAVASPPVRAAVASPVVKAQAAAPGRRSPPARPAARKQPSPTKEKPKQRLVMEEVRILKRGQEPPAPAPAPAPVPAPVLAASVAQAMAADQSVLCSTSRIGPQEPAVVPMKIVASPDAGGYAGTGFSAAAPEPSSLPYPTFFVRRAETEATRGLRCLLGIGQIA